MQNYALAEDAFRAFIDAYLVARDAPRTLDCLWTAFGTVGANADVLSGREAFCLLLERDLREQPLPCAVRWETLAATPLGDAAASVCGRIAVTAPRGNLDTIRLTGCALCTADGRWLVASVHLSRAGQSGDFALIPVQDDGTAHSLLEHVAAGGMLGGICAEDLPFYHMDDRLLARLGYRTASEFSAATGGLLCNAIHPDDRAGATAAIAGWQENGADGKLNCRLLTRDGGVVWISGCGRRIISADGRDAFLCACVDVSECKRLEEQLRLGEERFRLALEQIHNVVFDYDLPENTFYCRGGRGKLFGLPAEAQDFPNVFVRNGIVAADCAEAFTDAFRRIRAGDDRAGCEARLRVGAELFVWVKLSLASVRDHTGLPVQAVGVLEDITRQKELEAAYLREEQYRAAILSDVDFTYEINLTRNRIESMVGEGLPEALERVSVHAFTFTELLDLVAAKTISPDDRARYFETIGRENLLAAFERGETEIIFEHRRCHKGSGELFWALLTVHFIRDATSGDVKGFAYLRNIDKKKREELALRDQSQKDPLTGAFNKRMIEVLIRKCLEDFSSCATHAFLIMDIDNFKSLNDTFGHQFGDRALREISAKIREIFRAGDLIGRIGGDEFVVFIRDIPTRRLAERKAQEICELFRQSYGADVPFSCSIGLSFYPADADSFEELYRSADAALYAAKRAGRDGWKAYGAQTGRSNVPCAGTGGRWDFGGPSDKESLLDEISDMFYVSDIETYDMLYINRNGREVMGSGEDYHTRKCYELIQGRSQPCSFCTSGLLRTDEYFIEERTNEWLGKHFLVKSKLVEWNGRLARMELAMDITEQENRNREVARRLAAEDTLVKCIRQLSRADALDEVMPAVLGEVGTFYGADRTYMVEIDPAHERGRYGYEWCKAGLSTGMCGHEVDLSELVYFTERFAALKPVIIESTELLRDDYPRDYARLVRLGSRAALGIPYQLDSGETQEYGFLMVQNPAGGQADISLLESLSHFVASELQRRRTNESLRRLSQCDPLTGLPNRSSFGAYVAGLDAKNLWSLGVLVADNNGLKQINEKYGHKRGDEVILGLGALLQELFGAGFAFRLSGDEFVAMCENCSRDAFIGKIHAVEERASGISAQGISVGYSWRDEELEVSAMNHEADERMYLEKQRFYRGSGYANKRNRPEALDHLLAHLRAGHFLMYLQPKVDIRTGQIVGAEALARYYDEEYGLIPPVRFIEPLELDKLIRYLDLFIFGEVCKLLDRWRTEGRELLPISLNFSRLTILESDFMEAVVAIQDQYGVPSRLMEFEITETVGEIDRETVAEIGRKIKNNGFRLSLDDFGTKYTSISMLSTVKLDVLKLDRSLVKNLETSEHSRIVVQSMIGMCQRLNIDTIAEGVETEEQRRLLADYGCTLAQGYLYSKPLTVAQFEARMPSPT